MATGEGGIQRVDRRQLTSKVAVRSVNTSQSTLWVQCCRLILVKDHVFGKLPHVVE